MAMPGVGSTGQNSLGQAQVFDQPTEEIQQQITTFIEEGEVPESSMTMVPGRNFLAPAKDSLGNSVVGFLERPIEFLNFDWAATSNRGAMLTEIHFPGDWIKATMVREKLAGFRYLRCNFHVKVQINAQPMNAGRLFMVWVPFRDQMQSTPSSMLTVSGLTGYPLRVDLDLSESTAFDIEIPYCGNTSHFDLVRGMGTSGSVQLYVYSPLTGLSEVDGTVFIWASKIDVQLPTGLPIAIPSWSTTRMRLEAQAGDNQPDREFMEMRPEPSQSRLDAEKKPGLVTKILDIGGKIAMAASAIPTIGPFALAGGAIARGLAKLTSIFGWSKPMVDAVPTQVRPMYMRHMANYNGPFDGKQTAFDADNQTDIPTWMFGTEEDEMSFGYILKRRVFLDAFPMNNGQVAGTVLWKWPVDPTACRLVANSQVQSPDSEYTATPVQHNNTYLSYLANLFSYWRGQINYHFVVVKTVFHTARVAVIYVPGAEWDTDFSTVDQSKCYKKTVNLREGISFDVEVPYNWYTPWKELPRKWETTDFVELTPQGMLYVVVLNALKNPDTAAGNIEFIVETSAGDDFQFAIPGQLSYTLPLVDDKDTITELSQTALFSGEVQSAMFENPTNSDTSINALGIGESITSFRALLKRYIPFPAAPTMADTSDYRDIPSDPVANDPVARGQRWINSPDTFRWAAMLYRLKTGPMRRTVLNTAPSADAEYYTIPGAWDSMNSTTVPSSVRTLWSRVTKAGGSTEPALEAEIPFYQPFPAILTGLGNPVRVDTESTPGAAAFYKWTPNKFGSEFAVSQATGLHYRTIGERFSFGLMLGPPPTLSFTSSV